MRTMNERAVFDVVAAHGPISCAQTAALTAISKPTVSQALSSLVRAGLASTVGRSSGRPGRTGWLYGVAGSGAYIVSLDIGIEVIRAAVGDLTGSVVARVDRSVRTTTLRRVRHATAAVVATACDSAGIAVGDLVHGVVGSPGAVDPRRPGLTHVGRLDFLDGVDLRSELSSQLGVTLDIDNDINLAAVGEYALGHSDPNMAVLSVGAGVGAALILDGQLRRGPRGAAGEIESAPFGAGAPWRGAPRAGAALHRYIAMLVCLVTAVADVELVVLSGEVALDPSVLEPVRRLVAAQLDDPPAIQASVLGSSAVLLGGVAVAHRAAVDKVCANLTTSRTERIE